MRMARNAQAQELLDELIEIGRTHKSFDEEDVTPRVIEIGRVLGDIGGFDLMQDTFYDLQDALESHPHRLSYLWDGICDWAT